MSKKSTTEEFIKKAKTIHGDKYDYSKVEYINSQTKVCIICPEHGEFEQTPSVHLQGNGCPKCSKSCKCTQEEFIEKAKQVHGDKYDYSKVKYINSKTKVIIICPEHGEFEQTPSHHLRGSGCRKCWDKSLNLTTEEFIEKAKQVHGDKYDYSKVKYINSKTKVIIICPEHGEFEQTPINHLQGKGCSKCKKVYSYTTEEFIKKTKQVHGDKYDYSKTIYNGANEKVIITCKKHGDISIVAHGLLKGYGCIKCENEKRAKSQEDFINECIKIHGDKYDYSKVKYVNSCTKISIICPDHGLFEQIPSTHLKGCGCPMCKQSKLENEMINFLINHNIYFEYQKYFSWLGKQSLDFYLPDYNIAIECQGEQHFKPVSYFGGEEMFIKQQKRDIIKFELCKENNIKILYYTNKQNVNYFEKLINNINEILLWLKK